MRNIITFLLMTFFFTACEQAKPVLLFDESKVSKNDIVLLVVPNDMEIFKMDDQSVSTPMTSEGVNLYIPSGEHSFTVRYYCMWKSPSGDNNLLKSNKTTFKATVEPNKSYKISHKAIHNYDGALAMEKNPQFFLTELSGQSNNTANIKAPKEKEPVQKTTIPAKVVTNPNAEKKSLEVLKYIWESSSDEDKKRFLEWIEKEKK